MNFEWILIGILLLGLVFFFMWNVVWPIVKATLHFHQGMYAMAPEPQFFKEDFTSLFEDMTEPLILLDQNRRIKMMNPAALKLTGFTTGDLTGQPMDTLWAPFNMLDLSKITDRSLPYQAVSMKAKSGAIVGVVISGWSFKDSDNGRIGFMLVAKKAPAEKVATR